MKKGDPLSPALFINTAEALSRSLSALFLKDGFKGYEIPKGSAYHNHLSYVDDTVIFFTSDMKSLKLL